LLDGASLLLDLDGTLLDLVDRPDEVRADDKLVNLLSDLQAKLEGRLAVISGRSINKIDTILGAAAHGLAVAGSHGLEFRWNDEIVRPQRPEELEIAASRLRPFVEDHPGMILEEKSLGVALHYRMSPWVEHRAHALAHELAEELGLFVQPGKMMVELRAAGGDKGTAVERLMGHAPMAGTIPVFAGDDLTDEPGFAAARRLGGHGILVGPLRPTAADHALPSPAALRDWLTGVLG
jgi:trehalose 6-phosphate phosphatase